MSKVYISGPMTGIKNFNKEAFNKAEKELIAQGYETINPACLPNGFGYDDYMKIAYIMLGNADAIYLLKDWEKSKGALLELDFFCSEHVNPCIMKEPEFPEEEK